MSAPNSCPRLGQVTNWYTLLVYRLQTKPNFHPLILHQMSKMSKRWHQLKVNKRSHRFSYFSKNVLFLLNEIDKIYFWSSSIISNSKKVHVTPSWRLTGFFAFLFIRLRLQSRQPLFLWFSKSIKILRHFFYCSIWQYKRWWIHLIIFLWWVYKTPFNSWTTIYSQTINGKMLVIRQRVAPSIHRL